MLSLMTRDWDCISARHELRFLSVGRIFSLVMVDDEARASLARQERPHPLDENADPEVGRGKKLDMDSGPS
jgi:hypothetical protein